MDKSYKVYKHISPSGKIYIGITKNDISIRWRNGRGYKTQPYFYKAIKKYGWENFKHEILYDSLSKEKAVEIEIELIEKYHSNDKRFGYNIYKGGELGALGIEASIETRNKIREAVKGEKNPFYNKHHSEETIEKIKLSRVGKKWDYFKGKKHSDEAKKLMSIDKKEKYSDGKHPRARIICCYDEDDNLIREYKSLCIAAKETGFSKSCLSVACNKGKKYQNYYWKFKEVL